MLRKHLLCLSRCLLAVFCCLSTFTACTAAKAENFDPNRFADICASGKLEALREALEQGADPNIGPKQHPSWKRIKNPIHIRMGDTPLVIAVRNNPDKTDFVRLLLEHGAEVNGGDTHDKSALMEAAAAREARPEMTRLLLDAGAKVNAINYEGLSALHYALMKGNASVAIQLLEAGADLHIKTRLGKNTLHYAISPELVPLLVKAGVDVNAMPDDTIGESPLAVQAGNGHEAAVYALLQAGAKVNAQDLLGGTPLMRAAPGAHGPEMVQKLLEAGADIQARDQAGRTVLHYANLNRHGQEIAITRLLLARGADIHAQTTQGVTVLMNTASIQSENSLKLLALLLEHGANPLAEDSAGDTALAYVAGSDAKQKKALLRKAMAAAKHSIKPQ